MQVYWNDENDPDEKMSVFCDFRPGGLKGLLSRHILIPTYNYLT